MKHLTTIVAAACAAALLALSPGGEARAEQPLKLEGGRCNHGVVKLSYRRGASAPYWGIPRPTPALGGRFGTPQAASSWK